MEWSRKTGQKGEHFHVQNKPIQCIAEKLAILQDFEMGQARCLDVAQKYDISIYTLVKWRHRYELCGYEGLEINYRQN